MNFLPTIAPSLFAAWLALPIAVVIYFLLLFDARRKNSPAAGDEQLGLKTVAAVLAVVGTIMVAVSFQTFLEVILTFDNFWARIKGTLPSLLVGALGVLIATLVLFPSTNAKEFPKAKRLAAGMIALFSGVGLLPALAMFLAQLLDWPSWSAVAKSFSIAIDVLLVFAVSFGVLGKLSGIKMPETAKASPSFQR